MITVVSKAATIPLLRIIALKVVPKAFNNRALTSGKQCIYKEYHVPIMHRYLTFHMQDSGQYSINTDEASRL